MFFMGTKIIEFEDKSFLEYNRGKFDQFCLYVVNPDGSRTPPKDKDYFSELLELSQKYGKDKVYKDYVKVYEHTQKEIDISYFKELETLSKDYQQDSLSVYKLFSIFYLTMISEENRRGTKLGKRIKRLGVHYLLIEDQPLHYSINFMRGMGWREIDELCKERGF